MVIWLSLSHSLSLTLRLSLPSLSRSAPLPGPGRLINPRCNYFCCSLILLTFQLGGSSIRINQNRKESQFIAHFLQQPLLPPISVTFKKFIFLTHFFLGPSTLGKHTRPRMICWFVPSRSLSKHNVAFCTGAVAKGLDRAAGSNVIKRNAFAHLLPPLLQKD